MAESTPLAVYITERQKAVGETAVDVNDLRQRVRSGNDDGDFSLLYLWIRFWAKGGRACRTDMDAYIHGLQALSDNNALVLNSVIEELHDF